MNIKSVLNSSLKHFQTLRKTDKNLITFVVTELILKILLKSYFFFYQTLAYIEEGIHFRTGKWMENSALNVSNLNLWSASLDDLRHQYSGINHIQELKCIPIDHNQRGDDAVHFVPCLVKLNFIRFFKLLMPSRNVGKLIAATTKCYCYETSKHKIK